MGKKRICRSSYEKDWLKHRKPKEVSDLFDAAKLAIHQNEDETVVAILIRDLSYEELGYISANTMAKNTGNTYIKVRQYCSALREKMRAEDKLRQLEKELFNH